MSGGMSTQPHFEITYTICFTTFFSVYFLLFSYFFCIKSVTVGKRRKKHGGLHMVPQFHWRVWPYKFQHKLSFLPLIWQESAVVVSFLPEEKESGKCYFIFDLGSYVWVVLLCEVLYCMLCLFFFVVAISRYGHFKSPRTYIMMMMMIRMKADEHTLFKPSSTLSSVSFVSTMLYISCLYLYCYILQYCYTQHIKSGTHTSNKSTIQFSRERWYIDDIITDTIMSYGEIAILTMQFNRSSNKAHSLEFNGSRCPVHDFSTSAIIIQVEMASKHFNNTIISAFKLHFCISYVN